MNIIDKDLKKKLNQEIIQYMHTHLNDISWIEAVLDVCEKHELDVENIAKFLSKPIKDHLRREGEQRQLIKKRNSGKSLDSM